MVMGAREVLDRLSQLGVTAVLEDSRLFLEPGSRIPTDLISEVRRHKPEIVAYLRKPRLVNGPPEWHAREVAVRVEIDGVCIFWSEVLADVVAFYRTEEDRARIPAGIVGYSIEELRTLFEDEAGDLSPDALRLIHHAKQVGGGRVLGDDSAGMQPEEPEP